MILGLGNLLLQDDGVGVCALCELERSPPAGAQLADVGTSALCAVEWAREADYLLAIDAVRAGGVPGTVYSFDGWAVEERGPMSSLHSLGLRSAMETLAPGCRPREFRVVGVEPERLGYGIGLTERVAQAVPAVVKEVTRIAAEWCAGQARMETAT